MTTRVSEVSIVAQVDEVSDTASFTSQSHGSDVSLSLGSPNQEANDTGYPTLLTGDINTAAALRAQYAIDIPKPTRRRHKKMTSTTVQSSDDEPVVDHTIILPVHSKKTERLQRKQQKKSVKAATQQLNTTCFLSLPSDILNEIFGYLLPSDIPNLQLTCRATYTLSSVYESSIARTIIRRRYWTLYRCFPLPIAFDSVPADAHAALLSPRRQEMLNIHRKSYHQHVQMIDPHDICTCMTCVFAWNNLCLLVDLHHWQPHLENREPIPIIARGANPEWNQQLLKRNAKLVRLAMTRPLVYARILQMHLSTITSTISRNARWRRKVPTSSNPNTSLSGPGMPFGESTIATATPTSFRTSKPRVYHMAEEDVEAGTDEFLERSGPPSYDFPYMRDNYYSLEAYLPNRKWSGECQRWNYYGLPPESHERDLEWVRSWAMGVGWRG